MLTGHDTVGPGASRFRPLARWFGIALLIALVAAFAVAFVESREDLAALRRLSPLVVLAVLGLQFVSLLLFNQSMRLPLRSAGLGFWEWYLLRTGGLLAGALVPVAGNLGVRLAYLRRRGVSYADFTWGTLLSNAHALASSSVLALVACGLMWVITGAPPPVIVALSFGFFAICLSGVILLQRLPELAAHPRVARWRWVSAFSGIRVPPGLQTSVFLLSLARHVLNFFTFGLLYYALSGQPRAVLFGGMVYALTTPIRTVNLTPGNLGLHEWIVALVGSALAFDVTIGLLVAVLWRVLTMGAQAAGVLVAWSVMARSGTSMSRPSNDGDRRV